MICTKCGSHNNDDVRFCAVCGAPLGAAGSQQRRDAQRQERARYDGERYDAGQSGQRRHYEYDARERSAREYDGKQRQQRGSHAGYQPAQQQRSTVQPAFKLPPEKESSKKGVVAGIIIALVVAAIVLVVLFVFPGVLKGNPDGQSQAPAATSAETSAASQASADDTSGSVSSFDAKKAEQDARKAATGVGKQVFSGKVVVTNWYDRASDVAADLAGEFESMKDEPLVLLELDNSATIEARSAGDMGLLVKRPGGSSLYLVNTEQWSPYDGEEVTVAVHAADMWYPSDVSGALYTVTADNVALVAPLTESTAEAAIREAGTVSEGTRNAMAEISATEAEQKAQQTPEVLNDSTNWTNPNPAGVPDNTVAPDNAGDAGGSGDSGGATQNYYVMPDSSTYSYSKAELDGYSNYDLFLARNEIFARYGRQFQNPDLQAYFNSQSWYNGTIPPASFDDSCLTDIERHNIQTMLALEQERNSPYV